MDWLDPTTDYLFKRILCESEAALLSMINAILQPRVPIASARILNAEFQAEQVHGRDIRLDVLVSLKDGSTVDLEMQSYPHTGFDERLLYYFASMYSKSIAKGDGWERLRPVQVIAWCKRSRYKDTPFHSIYELRERRCNRALTKQCQIHVIDLEKLEDPSFPQDSPIARWAKFLAIPDPSRYDDAMEMDPGIKDAIATLDRLSKDPETRRIAQAREDALRMHYEALCASRDEGREEGREEGRKEGRVEGRKEGRVEGRKEGRVEGRKEGRLEGRAEGQKEGRLHMVRALLNQRFGPLSPAQEARLVEANEGQLDDWTSRLLSAKTIDDVFADEE